mmetsp:Transcript_4475/g.8970  ORF Transcript_4475/g.8970 Transcript_4475/m.8970 type:complete len:209 (+) Transcript_4475:959-1585(+)
MWTSLVPIGHEHSPVFFISQDFSRAWPGATRTSSGKFRSLMKCAPSTILLLVSFFESPCLGTFLGLCLSTLTIAQKLSPNFLPSYSRVYTLLFILPALSGVANSTLSFPSSPGFSRGISRVRTAERAPFPPTRNLVPSCHETVPVFLTSHVLMNVDPARTFVSSGYEMSSRNLQFSLESSAFLAAFSSLAACLAAFFSSLASFLASFS